MIKIINFKTYKYGKDSLKLAKIIEKVSKEIIVGIQPSEIYFISENTKLKVYSQHVDFYEPERATGFLTPESLKSMGAVGVFLNHSEHPVNFEILKKTMNRCKKLNLKTAVFASDLSSAKKIEKLKPDFMIYEPPELVGGNISVSTSKPELIKKISRKIKVPFLVGAGIKTKEDIERSLEFGAKGIAVSSVITTAKNPEKKLRLLFA
jgi:triosephosphate isomerase (TIM)